MRIFAVSDLHLSSVHPKPMDIFGDNWVNHWDKIKNDWIQKVEADDIVLIPGDISWALTLDEAMPDIFDIAKMPGRKILIRGNHDYWWTSATKIKRTFPKSVQIIQNDYIDIGNFMVCGTRGWMLPDDDRFSKEDEKIYKREVMRLDLSLSKAHRVSDKPIIVMMHYPPLNNGEDMSEYITVMKKYNVKLCVYGHLHGESLKKVLDGNYFGIDFFMASCDYLGFKLREIF